MPKTTTPDDFDPIFRQGVLVVGGHAVNLWGSYYAPRGDRELQQFAPFISKDGDIFLGDKELAKAVAAAAGWRFRDNPEARSSMLGHIYLVGDGGELRVDVLRSVTGLTGADLTMTEELRFVDGRTYLLPAPEVMLKAKLANLCEHNQEDRQDARHAQIMISCNRHYLADYYGAALTGEIPERDAVDRFMATHRVIHSPKAELMDTQYGLGLKESIPPFDSLGELKRLPKLLSFYDHQISRRQGPRFSV